MPRLKPNELHTLYPRVKSGEEITAELRNRQAKRKPKFIAGTVAVSSTFIYITVATFLWLFSSKLTASLSSHGGAAVISDVAIAMLAGLIGCIFVYYLSSTIIQLITLRFVSSAPITGMVIGLLMLAAVVSLFIPIALVAMILFSSTFISIAVVNSINA